MKSFKFQSALAIFVATFATLGLSRPVSGQILIDDFASTVKFAYGSLSNPSVGSASNYSFTQSIFDTSASVLGGKRSIAAMLAIASDPGSSATVTFDAGIAGGSWTTSFGIPASSGTGEAFSATGIVYGGITSLTPLAFANYLGGIAQVSMVATSDGTFLADFTGQTGLQFDIGALTASFIGMEVIDTSGNAVSLTDFAVGPGGFTVKVPFSAFSATPFIYDGAGTGPMDWAHISGIAVAMGQFDDGMTMEIQNLSTYGGSSAPEASSIAMLALGLVPMAGLAIRKRARK